MKAVKIIEGIGDGQKFIVTVQWEDGSTTQEVLPPKQIWESKEEWEKRCLELLSQNWSYDGEIDEIMKTYKNGRCKRR